FSKRKRSEVMSRIRGSGNRETELALATLMRRHGITGWRRNQRVFGRPDFVFIKERLAVFVDGCFWHGCPIHYVEPRTATGFWRAKITGNRTRDRRNSRTLRKLGWWVVRIWEHDFRKGGRAAAAIARIRARLELGSATRSGQSGRIH